MNKEAPQDLFKEPEGIAEATDLDILSQTRPEATQIIRENPDIFGFVIKREKERDRETGEAREVERKYVKILGIELEMNEEGEGTQFTAENFKGFALDKKSLESLKIMALGIRLNQPPLIEGPTDIGKSKSLEFLAYLTNHYLLYQSFAGQTDVTELIGKYVPAVDDVRVRFENLLHNRKGLKPETLEILRKLDTDSDRTTLTLEECKRIALVEKIVTSEELEKLQWAWSDGTVPRSIKYNRGRGCWLYFDELNAGEPQILVKIHRIFSKDFARLTITENSQNPEIEAVYPEWHPQRGKLNQFRLIATTNPPDTPGLNSLTKPFIRRWVYQRINRLSAEDRLVRADFVGHGRKPELPELKFHPLIEGVDLGKAPELDHLLNLVITQFGEQAQAQLDAGEWSRGEQEFRFDEFSDIERAQKYLREIQGPDIYETLREAIHFYYLGKIEASLPFYFDVDWQEKAKTAKEKRTKKLTSQDIENMQSERVKNLEAILAELLEGPTGPKIDGKSIKEKIKEEIEKLNPEIRKNALIAELKGLKKGTWQMPAAERLWSGVQQELEKYQEAINKIEEQTQAGTKEKDLRQAIEILESVKQEYQRLAELGRQIQQKLERKKDLSQKFKF